MAYTVKKNQDYLDIAAELGVDPNALQQINNFANLNTGQTIVTPSAKSYLLDGVQNVTASTISSAGQASSPNTYYDAGLGVTSQGPTKPTKPSAPLANGGTYGAGGPTASNQGSNQEGPTTPASSAPNTYYDSGLGVNSQGPTQAPFYAAQPDIFPTAQQQNQTQQPNPFVVPSTGQSIGDTLASQNKPNPFIVPSTGMSLGDTLAAQNKPTKPHRPSNDRPGFGAGASLDALGSDGQIGNFFLGAMAGFDPFGYEWQTNENGMQVLVQTGEQTIAPHIPIALPGNMIDYIQGNDTMSEEDKLAWLDYIASLYHYDDYSDQWITNDASGSLTAATAGGAGGGGGGGGGGGYGGAGNKQRYYEQAQMGLVNWRGVNFG